MGRVQIVTRRQVLGLGGAITVSILTDACHQSSAPAPTHVSVATQVPTKAPTSGPAATAVQASQKAETITVWEFNEVPLNIYQAQLPARIALFKKSHPNVTVNVDVCNYNVCGNKLEISLKAKQPPDVYHEIGVIPAQVATGLMVDLTPYLPPADRKDYYAFTLNDLTYEGKLYGFPDWVTMWCMAGNQTMLEDAGVDWRKVQKEGWTRDELVTAATKMTDAKKGVWGLMWNAIFGDGEELLWATRNDGIPYADVLTLEGKFTLTGPKAVESLQWLLDTFKRYKISPPEEPAMNFTKISDALNNWQAGIISRSGEWAVPGAIRRNEQIDAGKLKGKKFNAILLPWPHAPGEKEMGYTGVGCTNVFLHQQNEDAAHIADAAAYALLSAKEEDWQTAIYTGTLPARRSTAKRLEETKQHPLQKINPENYVFSTHYITTAPPSLILPANLDIKRERIRKEAVFPNFQAALAGTLTAEQAIAEMTAAAEKILATQE